ncbi:MAG: hypothetical protein JWQ96_577 [Segetibacter sp.]|nr:hypothetical protein [Segetibacter sp.]
MKKMTGKYAIKLAMLMACVLPLALAAQTDREFYGKPSYWRPYDKAGINVFETGKVDTIPFEGPRIRFGAGFTMQFQDLKHENAKNSGATRLYPLQRGFMTAQANLFTDVQLADGIHMNVTTYLSSRHHNEAWVKGGFIQIDKAPFLKSKLVDKIMEVATIKVGHMEINYGDAHFRRSDGGQTLYNPFMESYILDAFATEIGGEVYLQKNGLFGMLGVTNGMIKGSVDSTYKTAADNNTKRSPSIYLKGGVDKTLGDLIRVRVSGSYYHNGSAAASGQNLYGGDRSGSNYQNVMENAPAGAALAASTAIAFSGRVNPGFTKKVDAVMLNGFLKVKGVELFGTYETAQGRNKNEVDSRKASQLAGDVLYRFGKDENFYLGARYNTAKVELAKTTAIPTNYNVKVNRVALAAGWFMTRNILMKAELVDQQYKNFPTADYRNGGKFKGYVIEAVVGF